jgi:fermentation-respiration switch protein FrsA (DUF1100 family)
MPSRWRTTLPSGWYWGESLGSALAITLAAENPAGCLVLEAPFTSAVDVGAQHYWFVPVRLLMKDQFRSDLRIGKVRAPVLVVHGENDTIVPISLGERLFGLVRMPKRFARVAGAGHNDLGTHAVAAAKRFRATCNLMGQRQGLCAVERSQPRVAFGASKPSGRQGSKQAVC